MAVSKLDQLVFFTFLWICLSAFFSIIFSDTTELKPEVRTIEVEVTRVFTVTKIVMIENYIQVPISTPYPTSTRQPTATATQTTEPTSSPTKVVSEYVILPEGTCLRRVRNRPNTNSLPDMASYTVGFINNGQPVKVIDVVYGEEVDGNNIWYQLESSRGVSLINSVYPGALLSGAAVLNSGIINMQNKWDIIKKASESIGMSKYVYLLKAHELIFGIPNLFYSPSIKWHMIGFAEVEKIKGFSFNEYTNSLKTDGVVDKHTIDFIKNRINKDG
jgi:hypothetical protein